MKRLLLLSVMMLSVMNCAYAQTMPLKSALEIVQVVLKKFNTAFDADRDPVYQEIESHLLQKSLEACSITVSEQEVEQIVAQAVKKNSSYVGDAVLAELTGTIGRFFKIKELQNKIEEKKEKIEKIESDYKKTEIMVSSAPEKVSFTQWKKNIAELLNRKSNCITHNDAVELKKIRTSNLSKDMLIAQVKESTDYLVSGLASDREWLDGQLPDEDFFDVRGDYLFDTAFDDVFKPYVQKIVLPEGALVGIHGDLHGDIESINNCIEYWISKGYIDAQTFAIINPNFYILLLGDYTDRGEYGPEVIYDVLRLKNATPEKVFMVRGNHEEKGMNLSYGFDAQLKQNFEQSMDLSDAIYRWYNFLPLAIYLGSGDQKNKDFVQCCHGGIEMGYDPRPLISARDDIQYAKIDTLNYQEGNKILAQSGIKPRNQSVVDIDVNNGFMWSDFIVKGKNEHVLPSDRGQDIYTFGKITTDQLLESWSTDRTRLCGVFRAHQHADHEMLSLVYLDEFDTNEGKPVGYCHQLLGELVGSDHDKGVAKLWISPSVYDHKNNPGSLKGISVVTFCAAPASGKLPPFDYASLLTIGKKYEEWKLNPQCIYNKMIDSTGVKKELK